MKERNKSYKLYKNEYTDTISGHRFIDTNAFIKLSYIFNESDVLSAVMNDIVSTNLDNVDEFINKMIKFEKSRIAPNAKKNKHKFLVVLDIMLNKEYTNEELDYICKKIDKKYNELPYFAYTFEDGKAKMLKMFFCEREYSKEGEKVTKTYKYGRYADPITGEILKNKRKDAVIIYSKGEKVTTIEHFSNKTKTFVVINKKMLRCFIQELKDYLYDIYEEMGAEIIKMSPIKKIRYRESKRVFKPVIHKWNNTFEKVQRMIENIDKDVKRKYGSNYAKEIMNLATIINSEITQRKFKLSMEYMEIDTGEKWFKAYNNGLYKDYDLKDYKKRKVAIYVLRDYFNSGLRTLCDSYIFHIKMIIKQFIKEKRLPEEINKYTQYSYCIVN